MAIKLTVEFVIDETDFKGTISENSNFEGDRGSDTAMMQDFAADLQALYYDDGGASGAFQIVGVERNVDFDAWEASHRSNRKG